jgi:tetratricopeptide (TPR) repeat protein
LAAASRLADVFVAKGNPESALNILNDKIASLPDRQQDDLKVKRCYVLLLSGAIDSAEYYLTELVNDLSVKDDAFNDVLELKGFVDEHFSRVDEDGKEVFRNYISAELLLRQAKNIEAQALFRQTAKQYPKAAIAQECLFRAAEIDQQMGHYEAAINAFSELSTGDWGDKAATRIAEIYDMELADSESALKWYLTILNEYENSLLSEPVRYRIRELTKEKELN